MSAATGLARAQTYAVDCASPTRTLTGGGNAQLVINPGETLLLTAGTYTGGTNNLPADATLCVAADATLAPAYFNNAAGSIFNRGTLTFPSVSFPGTFFMENEGTVHFSQGVSTNGPSVMDNRGTVTVGTGIALSGGANFSNTGTVTVAGSLTLNSGVVTANGGTVTINGDFLDNGTSTNAGILTVAGRVIVNGGSAFTNSCRTTIGSDFTNNGDLSNSGIIDVSNGRLQNNGRVRQDPTGFSFGLDFGNDQSVSGYGAFQFTGSTSTQGTFVGDSAANPISFVDTSQTGIQLFDVQSGTVANTVRGPIQTRGPTVVPPGCGGPPVTNSADLHVTKTGPAKVTAGDAVSYQILVVNEGPRTAAAVTVTDALPAALTAVTASNGGVVAGGTVTWSLGDLASGTPVVLTVTGTAPGVGVLVDTVHGTSTTPDPDPSNNNGSHPDATVRTVVVAVPPPLNHPPTVADLALQTTANQATFGTVPAGDPDVGQTVSIALLGPPTNGTAFVDPNGLVRYTPSTGFVGRDSLTVRGCDDGVPVLCDDGTVTVVISPVAVGSSVQTTQDTPVSIDPASNDIGDTAPPTVVAGPTSGTVVLRADGTFLYTPDPGFLGSDSFDYRICSPTAPDVCAQARNTITVELPPRLPPVASDVSVRMPAGTTATVKVPTSEPQPGSSLTFTIATPPTHGTASVAADGTVTYTPTGAYTGPDTLTVRVCDDASPPLCDTATVDIVVVPVAADDAAHTPVDTPVDIDVKANDFGLAGTPTVTKPPTQGTVSFSGGIATYTPPAAFTGTTTFTYEICSPNDATACASARVTVAVDALPNHPPVLGDVTRVTRVVGSVSGSLKAEDPDAGQTLVYSRVTAAVHGTAVVSPTGDYTYAQTDTYVGRDAFTVRVCDDVKPTPACTTAQVFVELHPVALPVSTTIPVNSAVALVLTTTGDVGAPTVSTAPSHGTAVVVGDGITYTPADGFVGNEDFAYTVCGTGVPVYCTSAAIHVVVVPVVADDASSTYAGVAVAQDVTLNDVGTLGPPTIVTGPAHGTVSAGATLAYQPAGAYTGYDSVLYERCSTVTPTVCGRATWTISVRPLVKDDSGRTRTGVPVTVDVTSNDFGDATAPAIVRPPANGTVTVAASGKVTYTPLPGFVGVDSFAYERCSPNAADLCSVAIVEITVRPVISPQPPVTSTPVPSGSATTSSPTPGPSQTSATPTSTSSVTPTPSPSAAVGAGSESDLPFTGFDVLVIVVSALVLIAAGAALLGFSAARRRRNG